MEKFTFTSYAHKDRTHFDFDDALRIVSYTHKTPLAMLRELITGKIKKIKLQEGTLTTFAIPAK